MSKPNVDGWPRSSTAQLPLFTIFSFHLNIFILCTSSSDLCYFSSRCFFNIRFRTGFTIAHIYIAMCIASKRKMSFMINNFLFKTIFYVTFFQLTLYGEMFFFLSFSLHDCIDQMKKLIDFCRVKLFSLDQFYNWWLLTLWINKILHFVRCKIFSITLGVIHISCEWLFSLFSF